MSKSRDIADSAATINYIDNVTSDVQSQINTLDTALDNISVTSGTLTKTFANGETASINLTSSVLAPVVSVTKEVPQSGVTNNSWDVNSTTENYTRLDSAYDTTLDFAGFAIADSSYDSVSFSVNSQDTSMRDIRFSTDGTKMFTIGEAGDSVYEYALSTAFDISTASYTQSFSVASEEAGPQGLAFKPDGTKLYILGTNNDRVYQYTLSTAWDISTASYDSVNSAVAGNPMSLAFSNDGTKMFFPVAGETYQYNLSTAFDVSTSSYVTSFMTTSQDTSMKGISFNADGTKMFLIGETGDAVYQYSLSTAYTISTASYDSVSFSVASQSTTPNGIAFNNTGTKMYVLNQSGGTVYQYSVGISGLELGTGSFASADVGKTIEANSGAFVLTATDGSNVETTAPTSYAQVASGSWSMYGVVYNATDGDLELSGVQTGAFDISTAVYSQNFSVAAQETEPRGLAFSTDGTKMFITGTTLDLVLQYNLSTGFDVSTASYVGGFSVAAQDASPNGVAFSANGTKMFIMGSANDRVYQYTLSTAWDVSTASYDSISFSVASQELTPIGLCFNADGTKMFIVGFTNDTVYEYSLSTAYNISTASFVDGFSVSSQDGNPTALTFNADGTKMFVVGQFNDAVYQYSLSTGFDVSTASYVQTFSVASQDTEPKGIAFNTDGTKMFITGVAGDDINEYSIGSFLSPTGYQPVHTTASIDSTYWTDINSMTADQNAGDGNVYYAISTDDRTTWTVIDNTDGERDIVRNNAGTWQYNSNGTYALETWVNGTTNTELATLAEAMETAQNRMDKTQLDAVTDPNHIALGNDLDLAIVFNMTSGTTVPSSDGVAINYDANVLNKGAVLGTDYDFDAPTQNSVRITALAANNLKVRVV